MEEGTKANLGCAGLILAAATIFGGLFYVAVKAEENIKRSEIERYDAEIQESFNKNGAVERRDVNGDGIEDLVVRLNGLSGKMQKTVFYGTKDGRYQTAKQAEAQFQSDTDQIIREKYSVQDKK